MSKSVLLVKYGLNEAALKWLEKKHATTPSFLPTGIVLNNKTKSINALLLDKFEHCNDDFEVYLMSQKPWNIVAAFLSLLSCSISGLLEGLEKSYLKVQPIP